MKIHVVGGGPAGLYFAILMKKSWPDLRVTVLERNRPEDTFGFGVVFSDETLDNFESYDRETYRALTGHFAYWDDIAIHFRGTVHRIGGNGFCGCSRTTLLRLLHERARAFGIELKFQNEIADIAALTRDADLVVGADGSNSRLRDRLGLLARRKYLVDGCTRLLLDKSAAERAGGDGKTIEYWSGTRRILYTPCSETDIYIALTMHDRDEPAKAVPVRKDDWKRWFPQLHALIDRIGTQGRYDRFDLIKLKTWSVGRVAFLGDAAHALPPNIGQGGGCAMMNALSLAVYLERDADIAASLRAWERNERPMTEHTQRISYWLGLPTTWPPVLRAAALGLAGLSKWLTAQRTRTALHRPTGT